MIHKKHQVTRDVWDLACERAATCFKRFDTVALFFSGGKDSTAALHVLIEAARALHRLPLQVAFYDEEAIPPDTVDYCARVRATLPVAFQWLCVPIQCRNACSTRSPWWYPWEPELEAKWVRPLPAGAITTLPGFKRLPHHDTGGYVYPPSYGTVCTVMGIRTQESLNRFISIAGGKTGHQAYFSGDHWKHITRAYPIYDWSHTDVWLAAQRFGWDHNHAYDKMQAAGLSLNQQRCSPPFGEQPLERLWTYHVCWPTLWDKMTARVPGANTAGRYARTSLYAYGSDRENVKPTAMTWRDFTMQRLQQFAPDARALCAQSLRMLLKHHQLHSQVACPEDVPDPASGLCWKMIAEVAVRGDLKGGRRGLAIRAKAISTMKKGHDVHRQARAAAAEDATARADKVHV